MSDEPSRLYCPVNPSLGKQPSLGPIPTALLAPSSGILVGFYVLIEVYSAWALSYFCCSVPGVSPPGGWSWARRPGSLPTSSCPCRTGNGAMCPISVIYRTIMTKSRLGTQRFAFKPFEDETHLECLCRLQLRGRDVGAYLLKHRSKVQPGVWLSAVRASIPCCTGAGRTGAEATGGWVERLSSWGSSADSFAFVCNDQDRQQELETLIQTNPKSGKPVSPAGATTSHSGVDGLPSATAQASLLLCHLSPGRCRRAVPTWWKSCWPGWWPSTTRSKG
jgi:hypothetical protein